MKFKKIFNYPNKYNFFYITSNFAKIYFKVFLSKINKKKIVLINISEIHYFEHVKHYVQILNKINSVEIFITTRDNYIENRNIKSLGKFIFPIRFVKFTFFVDLFISPCIEALKPKGSYSIHVFHNQPIKYLSYPETYLKNFEEHFLWGSFMRSWMEDMLKKKSFDAKLTKVGNPRIDYEHNKIEPKNKNTKLFSIGYAPTWDKGLSLEIAGLEIIKRLLTIKNSFSHIRLHPCSRTIKTKNGKLPNGENWLEKIENIGSKNLEFSHNISTIEYLSKLDLLITDVSSISFEAFLLDIPVIFFHTNEFWDNYRKSIYKNFLLRDKSNNFEKNEYVNGGRSAGTVVYNIDELLDSIKTIKGNVDIKKSKRREFSYNLLYNKGKSSKVIKRRLEKLLLNK